MLSMAVASHAGIRLMVLLATMVAAEKLVARPARHAVPIAAVLVFAALVAGAGGGGPVMA
jgi:hypothetical protein